MLTQQGETPMYLGRVTRVAWNKHVVCTIDSLSGRDREIGPLPILAPFVTYSFDISSVSIPTHGWHSHGTAAVDPVIFDEYQKGDLVLVAQIGLIKEDLIVLGKVYSEFSGGCG